MYPSNNSTHGKWEMPEPVEYVPEGHEAQVAELVAPARDMESNTVSQGQTDGGRANEKEASSAEMALQGDVGRHKVHIFMKREKIERERERETEREARSGAGWGSSWFIPIRASSPPLPDLRLVCDEMLRRNPIMTSYMKSWQKLLDITHTPKPPTAWSCRTWRPIWQCLLPNKQSTPRSSRLLLPLRSSRSHTPPPPHSTALPFWLSH